MYSWPCHFDLAHTAACEKTPSKHNVRTLFQHNHHYNQIIGFKSPVLINNVNINTVNPWNSNQMLLCTFSTKPRLDHKAIQPWRSRALTTVHSKNCYSKLTAVCICCTEKLRGAEGFCFKRLCRMFSKWWGMGMCNEILWKLTDSEVLHTILCLCHMRTHRPSRLCENPHK